MSSTTRGIRVAFTVGLPLGPAVAIRAADPVRPVGPPANKPWKLVFSDEFEGKALDQSKRTRSPQGFLLIEVAGER